MFVNYLPAADLVAAARTALAKLEQDAPGAPETIQLAQAIAGVDAAIAEAGAEAHVVAIARDMHADDDHEIDDVPALSQGGDSGWWVSGWYWVPND